MIPGFLVALVLTVLLGSSAPAILGRALLRWRIIDVPNHRSSHAVATVRGGGLAPALALLAGYAVVVPLAAPADRLPELALLEVMAALAAVGWWDDVRGLPVRPRLVAQLVIGLLGALLIGASVGAITPVLIVLGLWIAAYTNVANFLDGINGISALHGGVVGIAFAAIGLVFGLAPLAAGGALLAAAFLTFLPWNARGRMFLGDVGSYLLGGGAAALGCLAVVSGVPVLAVVGPSVLYFADAGFTLLRRILRGERWYEAHRQHVYQRLVDSGLRHLGVAAVVTALSAATAALGVLSSTGLLAWPVGLVGMAVVTAVYLSLPALRRPEADPRSTAA